MELQTTHRQQLVKKIVPNSELHQAIQLLTYSSSELAEFIMEKAIENPLIEIDWGDTQGSAFPSDGAKHLSTGIIEIPDRMTSPSLEKYLFDQLAETPTSPMLRSIVKHLIACLDRNGYVEKQEWQILMDVYPEAKLEQAVKILQSFEPAGVGARSLGECLRLQLEREGQADKLELEIVENELEALAYRKFHTIMQRWPVSQSALDALLDKIKKLNPRPGSIFDDFEPQFIIPDAKVVFEQGVYRITIHEHGFPAIRLNESYCTSLNSNLDRREKRYLDEKIRQANWLVRSLKNRRETFYHVTRTLVRRQLPFFRNGPSYLKPMTLKDIAREISVHESTVSRVIQNKYLESHLGVFPYKYFFSSGVGKNTFGAASSKAIKHRIRQLIADEDKSDPLSDMQIVQHLQLQGINVSRRTITKYRKAAKIPPSLQRRYERKVSYECQNLI